MTSQVEGNNMTPINRRLIKRGGGKCPCYSSPRIISISIQYLGKGDETPESHTRIPESYAVYTMSTTHQPTLSIEQVYIYVLNVKGNEMASDSRG